ncbi:hypothetical protein BRD15_02975 [Halobacteriales archaeon SW_6_65_15]|nr:MAG: hypothetical protein BRD15_02975 [Halobacteriales archaeon SW_6_65_15]
MSCSRREFLGNTVLATAGLTSGCLSRMNGVTEAEEESQLTTVECDGVAAESGLDGGIRIENYSRSNTTMYITVDREHECIFNTVVNVAANANKTYKSVFPEPTDNPINYSAVVELESGETAEYNFTIQEGTGFYQLNVEIQDGRKIQISQIVS